MLYNCGLMMSDVGHTNSIMHLHTYSCHLLVSSEYSHTSMACKTYTRRGGKQPQPYVATPADDPKKFFILCSPTQAQAPQLFQSQHGTVGSFSTHVANMGACFIAMVCTVHTYPGIVPGLQLGPAVTRCWPMPIA
jgi:hypothetical protein